MLHVCSILAMALVGVGLFFRRRRPSLHWKLMIAAFVMDVSLVLYIEIARHAVEQLPTARPLIVFHATVSVLVLVLYLVLFGLGSRLLKGRFENRNAHRNAGFTFVALRTVNLVTSFLV